MNRSFLMTFVLTLLFSNGAIAISGGNYKMNAGDPLARSTVIFKWTVTRPAPKPDEELNTYGRCVGTLISTDLVVTAAHCLSLDSKGSPLPKDAVVLVYFLDQKGKLDETNPIKAKYLRFPGYKGYSPPTNARSTVGFQDTDRVFDIAVIRILPLKQIPGTDPDVFSDDGQIPINAKPAKLFLGNQRSISLDDVVTAVGVQLQTTTAKSKQEAQNDFVGAKIQMTLNNPDVEISHLIKAFGPPGNGGPFKGPQLGDSGGPLYANINGTNVLVGVLARLAYPVSQPYLIVDYEPMSQYFEWIKEAGRQLDADIHFQY